MNQTENRIRHEGVIERIDGQHVVVSIAQTSACAACKMSGHCSASERKIKEVDVYSAHASAFAVGQHVVVWASRSTAFRALLYGFGWPFLLMVVTLMAVLWLTANEAKAAVAAILVLLPYYALLALFRQRISNMVVFHIETV